MNYARTTPEESEASMNSQSPPRAANSSHDAGGVPRGTQKSDALSEPCGPFIRREGESWAVAARRADVIGDACQEVGKAIIRKLAHDEIAGYVADRIGAALMDAASYWYGQGDQARREAKAERAEQRQASPRQAGPRGDNRGGGAPAANTGSTGGGSDSRPCTGCGRVIYWGKRNDSWHPYDDEDRTKSHFDTCPNASQFRRGGGRRRTV